MKNEVGELAGTNRWLYCICVTSLEHLKVRSLFSTQNNLYGKQLDLVVLHLHTFERLVGT
jgi:hypothetical protein